MKIKPEQNSKCNANAELLLLVSSKDYCDLQAHAMVILHKSVMPAVILDHFGRNCVP
jgi:hypothetical protein